MSFPGLTGESIEQDNQEALSGTERSNWNTSALLDVRVNSFAVSKKNI